MKLSKENILKTELSNKQIGVWYLGQEGILLKSTDDYLAIDPYLSDYVDKNCCEFVKWERLYAPPIECDELSFLNLVLCTHSHYDHADPITLSAIAKSNPKTKFVIPAPVVDTVTGYGIDVNRIIPAKAFEEIVINGFKIIPIPSAHEELHEDDNGDYFEVGYVIETNGQTFFHAGDMCMYDGLIESLNKFDIKIAFLPINGRDFFRNRNDIIGNFTADEAVLLAKEIKADMLVPIHHDLYGVNCVSTASFAEAVSKNDPLRRHHVFAPGELYISY